MFQKIHLPLWGNNLALSSKTEVVHFQDTDIPFVGLHGSSCAHVLQGISTKCSQQHSVIAKLQKQAKCPKVGKCIETGPLVPHNPVQQ